jgi:pyridoxal biosynthesis lyase PdxS
MSSAPSNRLASPDWNAAATPASAALNTSLGSAGMCVGASEFIRTCVHNHGVST